MERPSARFSPEVHEKRSKLRLYIHYLLEEIPVDDVAKELGAEEFVRKEFDGKRLVTLFDVERFVDAVTEKGTFDDILKNEILQ